MTALVPSNPSTEVFSPHEKQRLEDRGACSVTTALPSVTNHKVLIIFKKIKASKQLENITVRERNTFSCLGQAFNAVDLVQGHKTFSQKSVTST